jgi:putative ABC transport system substrate-binding protein
LRLRSRAGIIYNPDQGTMSRPLWQAINASAQHVAVELVDLPVRNENEIEPVIARLASNPNVGLIFPSDLFTVAHRARIIAVTNGHQIPAIFPYRYFAVDGGLVAYSPSQTNEFGQAAYYVDQILRGQ